jgi:DNA-directed RNA polymerase specialized sigma subunit
VEIQTNVRFVASLWGMVHMDKHNAKTRKKLKQISSVKDFESLIEQTMLSEEEKKILWLHYKEQKTMAFIADELGMSEITVKKKHSKMLMKIGKMF